MVKSTVSKSFVGGEILTFNLTILSTSDVHGFVYPTNFVKRHLNLPFGLLKAAQVIENERKNATGPVLTVDAGDVLEGSPLTEHLAKFSTPPAPQRLLRAYNAIGYDVGVLGNHEFNYGLDYLKKRLKARIIQFYLRIFWISKKIQLRTVLIEFLINKACASLCWG